VLHGAQKDKKEYKNWGKTCTMVEGIAQQNDHRRKSFARGQVSIL
jgi:hypothetical protein